MEKRNVSHSEHLILLDEYVIKLTESQNQLIDENEKLKEAIRYLADIPDYQKHQGWKSAKLNKINEIFEKNYENTRQ